MWKTTSSKKIPIEEKFEQAKKKLEELYEQYRSGGNWEQLLLNINHLLGYRGIQFFPVIDFQFIEFDGFEDQIKEFKAAGKVALRKFLDDINATDTKMNGRINEDTILLKVA